MAVRRTAYAIKVEIADVTASTLAFDDQKTMYSGKSIAPGDAIFVFASENSGGVGLIAKGVVTAARATPRKAGIARQTPRVSIAIRCTDRPRKPFGRDELRRFNTWDDGRPETELNFKLYRQATDKIVGLSDDAAEYLSRFF